MAATCGAMANAPENRPMLIKRCPDCGADVYGVTAHRQFCNECKEKRKRDRHIRAAEKQRRKKGIPKVKGATFTCEECGAGFAPTSKSRQRYCCECGPKVALRSARERSFLNDKDGARLRVGRECKCAHCGSKFTVMTKGARHKYCEECRELSDQNKLPHNRAAGRTWRKHKRASDPKFVLSEIMRRSVSRVLNGSKGGRSWESLVGYTVEELREHLERQFLPGMTWGNRGLNGWHIDHIRPISSFSYTSSDDPEFKECWALTNLRPMWGSENIRKKDQRIYLI